MDKKHVFEGMFLRKTPRDIGGAGTYTHWNSTVGSTYGYVERFRGNDDLHGQLDKQLQAADALTNFLIGWFRSEIDDDQTFEQLRDFMDGPLRRDLKNLAVYAFVASANSQNPVSQQEYAMRIAQYFLERGYYSVDSLPSIPKALNETSNGPQWLQMIRQFVTSKTDEKDPNQLASALEFLSTSDRVKESLTRYSQTTREYQVMLREWRKEHPEEGDDLAPTPDRLLGQLIYNVVGFGGTGIFDFTDSDDLHVTLACPEEPYFTNGEWNEETKTLEWTARISSEDRPLNVAPVLHYAFWSVADESFQQEHFGKRILQREELAAYNLWHQGLDAKEAQQWDTFIAAIEPGQDLEKKLKAFRFFGDPAQSTDNKKNDHRLANWLRRLIVDGFKKATKD